jgi:hypothetical protein
VCVCAQHTHRLCNRLFFSCAKHSAFKVTWLTRSLRPLHPKPPPKKTLKKMTTDAPPAVAADSPPPAVDAPAAPAKKAGGPVPRLPKPDGEAHKAALAALEATIAAKKERVAEIKALLDARAEDRKTGGSPEVAAARAKLGELRDSFKAELVRGRGGACRMGRGGGREARGRRGPSRSDRHERKEKKTAGLDRHARHAPSFALGGDGLAYCWRTPRRGGWRLAGRPSVRRGRPWARSRFAARAAVPLPAAPGAGTPAPPRPPRIPPLFPLRARHPPTRPGKGAGRARGRPPPPYRRTHSPISPLQSLFFSTKNRPPSKPCVTSWKPPPRPGRPCGRRPGT